VLETYTFLRVLTHVDKGHTQKQCTVSIVGKVIQGQTILSNLQCKVDVIKRELPALVTVGTYRKYGQFPW
jgi:hypothetical protein